jgi:hypothetical protein
MSRLLVNPIIFSGSRVKFLNKVVWGGLKFENAEQKIMSNLTLWLVKQLNVKSYNK